MKIKILISILAIALLQSFVSIERAVTPTVHVIVFAESNRADKIYKSCQKDADLIKAEMQRVGKYTGMHIRIYPTSFTKNSCRNVIANLKCGPDDVIFFYYSGHGYNGGNSSFPSLNFNESSSTSDYINLFDIHTRLKRKNARLVFTIGDCCNKEPGKNLVTPLRDPESSKLRYKRLFRNLRGEIIAMGCEKGQYSYVYKNGKGSYFTVSFLKALHEAIEFGAGVSWKSIFDSTMKKTKKVSDNDQEPVFEVKTAMIRVRNTYED